jgi:GH25 family lysozyme M1 (1,4-beta-N-acetylmuramidase)
MMAKTILDVSRWQGDINWDAVKASRKIDGVMLKTVSTNSKLSKRKDGLYIDPTFERNYAECKRLGIPVGVYYYTYAVSHTSADAELALLKTALTGKTFELPVCVDVEDNKLKKLRKQALTDLTAYALATIEQWGFYALLYTGLNFGETRLYMGGAALRKYDVWVAAYHDDKPTPAWPFGMWQYTSTASVPGITGNADLSHAYKDYAAIIAKKGLDMLREG